MSARPERDVALVRPGPGAEPAITSFCLSTCFLFSGLSEWKIIEQSGHWPFIGQNGPPC